MSDFDKWKRESFPNTKAKDAWNHQQDKLNLIKNHIDSFYSESEIWGFDSDQALHQIDLIQELLK